MSDKIDQQYNGIASLFDRLELKGFFKTYILFIFILEILIFFFCFLCQLEPINIPFPWKTYFLASFIIPIAITFMIGIFVTAFNIYIFGRNELNEGEPGESKISKGDKAYLKKIKDSLNFLRQVPFLLILLGLVVSTLIFSKMDAFLTYVGNAGEAAFKYLLIALAVVFAVGTVFGLIWMIMNYKLQKIRYQYQFKSELLAKQGLLFQEDKKLLRNADGQVFMHKIPSELSTVSAHTESEKQLLVSQSNAE